MVPPTKVPPTIMLVRSRLGETLLSIKEIWFLFENQHNSLMFMPVQEIRVEHIGSQESYQQKKTTVFLLLSSIKL